MRQASHSQRSSSSSESGSSWNARSVTYHVLPLDKTASRLPDLIKDMRLVVVEGAPHAIAWTHADQVNTVLLDFLRAGTPAPAITTKGVRHLPARPHPHRRRLQHALRLADPRQGSPGQP
jgi:hypothetical protein